MIYTISRVKPAGKWLEFWFAELPQDEGAHMSDKWGNIIDSMEKAGLDEQVLNNGYVGLRCKVEKHYMSLIFKKFVITLPTPPPTPAT